MGEPAQPVTPKAAPIASAAELTSEAMELLQADPQPPEYISLLVEKKFYPDAVRFLAHALPRREAVWWAWMCARRSAGDAPPPPVKSALEAAEKWLTQPTEENRRTAHATAEAAGFGTAAGCAGLAAFFSGGSLAPPDAPPVPPGEFLTAKAVAGAVIFAAVTTQPEKAPEKFQSFIAQGVDVTTRIKLWERK